MWTDASRASASSVSVGAARLAHAPVIATSSSIALSGSGAGCWKPSHDYHPARKMTKKRDVPRHSWRGFGAHGPEGRFPHAA
jgi:hypothetical protein